MISKVRSNINFALALCKWPSAFVMLLCVPTVIQAFQRYYEIRHSLHRGNLLYFAIGLVFFFVMRLVFVKGRGATETMEHEMTHTLFALATLHPVHRMEVHDSGGGSMSFSGGGNWLITIAPYFFPLAAIGMVITTLFVEALLGYIPEWTYIGLGAAVAYNIISFAQQTHPHQTDFKVAGYLFTICFLPGANLLAYGMIFAFTERGFKGIAYFCKLILYYVRQDASTILNKMTALI